MAVRVACFPFFSLALPQHSTLDSSTALTFFSSPLLSLSLSPWSFLPLHLPPVGLSVRTQLCRSPEPQSKKRGKRHLALLLTPTITPFLLDREFLHLIMKGTSPVSPLRCLPLNPPYIVALVERSEVGASTSRDKCLTPVARPVWLRSWSTPWRIPPAYVIAVSPGPSCLFFGPSFEPVS